MIQTLVEQWKALLVTDDDNSSSASIVLAGSDYVMQWGIRYVDRAEELLSSGDILRVYDEATYSSYLATMLTDVVDETRLHQQLRQFRQREMVRIIWRDLAGFADLAETMRDLSALADACIEQSLLLLHQWQAVPLGKPVDADGHEQYLIILGMGKLGAGELNLSSDIDLIFTYPEQGHTQGGRKSLSNGEFFTRLGRKLIQALDTITVDGFVFRVDMRLRPFGDSGALAACFDAMEGYYQTQGREWERYAMIKARAITGSDAGKKMIMDLLRPFVYRRYLDYGMLDAMREMKRMIAAELHKKGMEENIKLGRGGIREIEFIGQVFQLIHGGRDKSLQQRPILTILDRLAQRGALSVETVAELKQAYDFLRRTEHRIQAWADKQTHCLPQDDAGQYRIAKLMGFKDWQGFFTQCEQYRAQVFFHFEQLLELECFDDGQQQDTFRVLEADEDALTDYFQQHSYDKPSYCIEKLQALLASHTYRNLGDTERGRLAALLPLLIQAVANTNYADICFARMLTLLEAILRRTAYISLLVENPKALEQLAKLCAASPWISTQLTHHPVLLDELLDPHKMYDVPERKQQEAQLKQHLEEVDITDLERQMFILREFKQVTSLHIAAADITGILPLMEAGKKLTELAEIQLESVMRLAWQHLVSRHGYPPNVHNDDLAQCGFSILAYGKLGSVELGYGSDLDIVFLFDDSKHQGSTTGDKPIDALVFYIRLAQRMIHILNAVTTAGLLYDVDMRLRPNGESGLLVTALSAFKDYQNTQAWTWEHQALVRARCVAGDVSLSQQFQTIRQKILTKKRDKHTLISEVSDMRVKMRDNLDKSTKEEFDLKQGVGGITDIEFLVQYAVLSWTKTYPELAQYTDNIRIMETLQQLGKLNESNAKLLISAYRFYRQLANHCVLQEQPARVIMNNVGDYPTQVKEIWQKQLS